MIEITNLHKSFGTKNVLAGVDITVQNGSTLCVIGKSGCGKSVLLKHIVGLLYPDRGSVKIDDREVGSMTKKELFEVRRSIGYVFQGSALFDSYTVYENIIIGLYEHGARDFAALEREAKRTLSAVGLLPDMTEIDSSHFQKEWKTLKDKKPSDLSGGMRKRVGVARALVGNPKYVFYDEPTTGLDPVTSEQIDDLIIDLAKKLKVTSLVITHDMFSVFRMADSVSMLESGQVAFSGTPDELRRSDNKDVREFLDRYER